MLFCPLPTYEQSFPHLIPLKAQRNPSAGKWMTQGGFVYDTSAMWVYFPSHYQADDAALCNNGARTSMYWHHHYTTMPLCYHYTLPLCCWCRGVGASACAWKYCEKMKHHTYISVGLYNYLIHNCVQHILREQVPRYLMYDVGVG